MDISLIIAIDNNIPSKMLNMVLEHHRKTINLKEIICVSWGRREKVDATLIEHSVDSNKPYNLSYVNNLGAIAAQSEDLIFCNADIVFEGLSYTLDPNKAIRGTNRRDVRIISEPFVFSDIGPEYACSISPFIIKRNKFLEIGGFCTQYSDYGHEDSDIFLKVQTQEQQFNALHLLPIHNNCAKAAAWDRGKNANLSIYEQRKAYNPKSLIEADKLELAKIKGK